MIQADLVSQLLTKLASVVEPGMTTEDLDTIAEAWMVKHSIKSENRGYHPHWASVPYPNVICTSVNDVVSHGIPNNQKLKSGDIVTIDVGINYMGIAADAALTVGVGEIANREDRMLRYARRAVYAGAAAVKPGATTEEVGIAIKRYASTMGYNIDKIFGGHDIGKTMHGSYGIPMTDVTNVVNRPPLHTFTEGEIICIEPHLTLSKFDMGMPQDDGWSWKTRDGKPVAMFEHMVLVTKDGYQILTSHFDDK